VHLRPIDECLRANGAADVSNLGVAPVSADIAVHPVDQCFGSLNANPQVSAIGDV
jgi:hypothetical protein